MTIKDLDKYYNELMKALTEQKSARQFNKDRAHNTTVMRLMFDTSDKVQMYCGEMSVFRNPFYEHINSNNPSEENGKGLGDLLKDKLNNSLEEFFKKENARLTILLEDDTMTELPEDLIAPDLIKDNLRNGKIIIKRVPRNLVYGEFLSHFAFTDKILRLETDKKEHSAICMVIFSEETRNSRRKTFYDIDSVAIPIL